MKLHHIEVCNRSGSEGRMSTSFNTQILLDGKPLDTVRSFSYHVDVRGIGVVTLELYADVKISGNFQLHSREELARKIHGACSYIGRTNPWDTLSEETRETFREEAQRLLEWNHAAKISDECPPASLPPASASPSD